MAEVDERFGLDRLACLHVNDSAVPSAPTATATPRSGPGVIGKELAVILGHPAVQELPR